MNDLILEGLSIIPLILLLAVNEVLEVGQYIDKAVHEQLIELAGILVYRETTE
jgi:hypothetical protein